MGHFVHIYSILLCKFYYNTVLYMNLSDKFLVYNIILHWILPKI